MIWLKKHNTKVTEIEKKLTEHNHDKYIDTSEFNKLATNIFNARIAQTNVISKTDFDSKLSNLNRKISTNKTKHLLAENELNKLKTFHLSYFIDKSHFEEDGTQNYLVFQWIYKYFKQIAGAGSGDYIYYWKSKGLTDENIKNPSTPNNFPNPSLKYLGTKPRVRFSKSRLKQNAIT